MCTLKADYRFGSRRWFRHYFRPKTYIHWVLHFYQRGSRGWADCDTWSLDSYLAKWMPDALRYLKDHKHGIPTSMFEEEDCGADGNASAEGMKRAEARWDAVMNKMISGFEAHRTLADGMYEKELGEYLYQKPPGISEDDWNKTTEERFQKVRELDAHYRIIMEECLALFVKHYESLWD